MSDFLGSSAGLTFAILLVAATFILYFFKHLTESFERRRSASARAERLVGALYAEIRANLEGLGDFVDHNPTAMRMKQAVRDDPLTKPHFRFIAHTLVYESHLSDLSALPHAVVLKVVAFYSQLERFQGVVEGFEDIGFANLPAEQRAHLVDELWRNIERSEKLGRDALHALEVHVPLLVMRKALAAA
jgi:hypothetical protein